MKKLTLWLAACCAALTLAACGAGGSPEKVAEKYVQSVYAGDAETVLQTVYFSDEMKQEVGVEEMVRGKIKAMVAEQKQRANAKGGVKDISSTAAEYSNENTEARVSVTTTFKKADTPDTQQIRLIKSDDGWKVKL
ncbi:MAG: DUF4878 domain-containing protein [Neisseria sp.]|nr:DUF4878 domain-containing protein [Neisseria sp.]